MAMGDRIRAARQQAGLTIEALATKVGVSAATMSRIETGRRVTSTRVLERIVSALGIDTPASKFMSDDPTELDVPAVDGAR
jgi:transcriptional regulator with XRE-family HTH domain